MLRVASKVLALSMAALLLAPLQWVLLRLAPGRDWPVLPRLFHRITRSVLGLRVELCGFPADGGRVVFISNHLSYLDIPVLGSILDARFVAKDDISEWPVFGSLARLQRTVFVRRDARRAAEAGAAMQDALVAGDCLVLFPEGTTTDGSTVLPFKSSAFAGFVGPGSAARVLQPVTLELLAVDGTNVTDAITRDRYAYYGEMQLGPHLLAFMAGRGARMRLTMHPPVSGSAFADRKALANHLQQVVTQGLQGVAEDAEASR